MFRGQPSRLHCQCGLEPQTLAAMAPPRCHKSLTSSAAKRVPGGFDDAVGHRPGRYDQWPDAAVSSGIIPAINGTRSDLASIQSPFDLTDEWRMCIHYGAVLSAENNECPGDPPAIPM